MSIIPDGTHGTGGDRRLAYVVHDPSGDLRLIVRAGVRSYDLIGAAGSVPADAILGDFVAARDSLVLVFRSAPAGSGDAVTMTPERAGGTPGTADGGWLPDTEPAPVPLPPAGRIARLRDRHRRRPVAAFWTVTDGALYGPWDGRADAMAAGRDHPGSSVVYGTVDAAGAITTRTAPDDLAVSRAVAAALDRVVDDDDRPVRATRDAVAELTVKVARTLVLVGLPVADTTGRGGPAGGVMLAPTRTPTAGVALWWAAHMLTESADPAGGYPAQVMATATAAVLDACGYTVSYDPRHGGVPLVIAARASSEDDV